LIFRCRIGINRAFSGGGVNHIGAAAPTMALRSSSRRRLLAFDENLAQWRHD